MRIVASRQHRLSQPVTRHLCRRVIRVGFFGSSPGDEARGLIAIHLRNLNVGNPFVLKEAKYGTRKLRRGDMVRIERDEYVILLESNLLQPCVVVPVLAASREPSTFPLVMRQTMSAEVPHANRPAEIPYRWAVAFIQQPCVMRIVKGHHGPQGGIQHLEWLDIRNAGGDDRNSQALPRLHWDWSFHQRQRNPSQLVARQADQQ